MMGFKSSAKLSMPRINQINVKTAKRENFRAKTEYGQPNYDEVSYDEPMTHLNQKKPADGSNPTLDETRKKITTLGFYHIDASNVESMSEGIDYTIFKMKDGSTLRVRTNPDTTVGISIVEELNNDGTVKKSITYDESGNKFLIKTYEYTANKQIFCETVENKKKNTVTQTFYKNGKAYTNLNPLVYDAGKITADEFARLKYTDYSDTERLSVPITDKLSDGRLNRLNADIYEAVDYAGRGTGAGVAAAATTLVVELKKEGILLPYYYSGGHTQNYSNVDRDWGTIVSKEGLTCTRNKKSFDCSGFASWAMRTAGIDETPRGANEYQWLGPHISFEEAGPGDVLSNSTHVILVVDSYEDAAGERHLICAESTGDYATEASYNPNNYDDVSDDKMGGVMITDYTSSVANSYAIVDMDEFYAKHQLP